LTDSIFWLQWSSTIAYAEDTEREGDLVVDVAHADRVELSLPGRLDLAGGADDTDAVETVAAGRFLDQVEVRADGVARSGGGQELCLRGRNHGLGPPGLGARTCDDGTVDDALFKRVREERRDDTAVLGLLQDVLVGRACRDYGLVVTEYVHCSHLTA